MKTITESDLQPATTPGDGWYIIEAAGEHATRVEDAELTQRLTPEVLAAVAAAGVPAEGLPIDRDHLSLDAENSTEAMGWVRELAMCGRNLAARIEWTSLGLPLITGRVYKHFSTVYPAPTAEQLEAGVYEPAQLIGLALTNQPNNREGQPPITNKCNQYAHDPGCPDAEGGSAGTQDADLDDTPDEMPEDADEATQERYMEASSMASAGVDREEIFAVTGVDVGKTDIDREYEDMVAAGADERAIYKQTGIDPRRYEKRRAKRRAARRGGQKPAVANSAEDFSEGKVPEGSETVTKERTMNEIEDIKKALGLAPEATAADCVAAIESIKGEAAAAADSEAETLLNSEGLSDLPEEEKKEIKEGLVTNRGLAMMTIRAYKERKQQGAAPQARYAKAGTPRTAVGATGSVVINRAKEIQRAERAAGRTCSFWKAHGMAKNELNK